MLRINGHDVAVCSVVSWELDGGDLVSGTRLTLDKVQGHLTIADVRASDTGTYSCYIDHEHTDGNYGDMSASIELHVVSKLLCTLWLGFYNTVAV